LTEHSPCFRPIVVYYFQSAREKAGHHRASAGAMKKKWPEPTPGASEDAAKIITAARFTSHVVGQEL
jgi:hypothetical protein